MVIIICILAFCGVVTGFLAGLLGIGGGIVLVPALFHIFLYFPQFTSNASMHVAVGTSLAITIPTAISSSMAHWRRHSVSISHMIYMAPGLVMGATIGVVAAGFLRGDDLRLFFSIIVALLACYMVYSNFRSRHVDRTDRGLKDLSKNSAPIPSKNRARPIRLFAVSNLTSFIAVLMGIGGATLNVPFLRYCGLDMMRAVGTAALGGLIISIPGAIGFLALGLIQQKAALDETVYLDGGIWEMTSLGYVHGLVWICIAPFSVLMAPIGAKCAHILPANILKNIFAAMMIIVALKMIFS